MSEMRTDDAFQLYKLLTEADVTVWLDGGWAVDALLGAQSRPHGDLDVVIPEHDVPLLRSRLAIEGFREVQRDDSSDWNFVLEDNAGRSVDVHVVVFDDAGNGIYGPPENHEAYPTGCLGGVGTIAGRPVQCVTADQLVIFHTGYPLRSQDIHDVIALCSRFDIPVPEDYRA
jgi:lincosamide nucleotidyltransferase A/C/D/E